MPQVYGESALDTYRTATKHRFAVGLLLLVCLPALQGCHNRAHSDLYVESMAAEIRDLEDQLYEYDHEYQALEQELSSLRAQNAALRNGSANGIGKLDSSSQSVQPLPFEFQPRTNAVPLVPEPSNSAPSILEDNGAPDRDSNTSQIPMGTEDIPPPEEFAPSPFPANNSVSPRSNANPPNLDAPDFEDIDAGELLPPMIEAGEPMPPPLSMNSAASQISPESDLEMNLSRIEVPAKLASSQLGVQDIGQATIKPGVEKVTDTRVVELAFHPSLSRAANFDDRTDDDGLYLVLQPRNERGQMVPISAQLSIVVLDPAREGDAARIGRWDYSAADVQSKMQPIGSNQGIHLTLPWNGPDPTADRVLVFVRYTFDNGRQVIGQKEIFVNSEGSLRTVWAPRGDSSREENNPVQTASAALPRNQVVRPASGSSEHTNPNPAPAPQGVKPATSNQGWNW